jgi:hypothetical protein
MENIQNADQIEPLQPMADEVIRKASPAQLSLIEKFINEGKPQPPKGYKDDMSIARKYIEETIAARKPKPASASQMDLISKICDALSITADDITTAKQAFDFIEAHIEEFKKKSKKSKPQKEEEAIEDDFA